VQQIGKDKHMTQQDVITALETAKDMLAQGKNPASVAKDLVRLIDDMKDQNNAR
jgi:DNA polymerase III gamma/tau subunit